MNKKIIGVFMLIFIIAIMLVLPNQSFAVSSLGYTIDSYDINMKVNENNTYDITETIVANFTASNKHGIIRKIPLSNTVKRLDGSTSRNRAKVSNISVNNEYTKDNSNGYVSLKIGDPDKTIRGKQEYVIKYTYDIGSDPLKDADEFYYNLIGDQWDTSIKNISFTITMPKAFDSSNLGFSSGVYGSVDNTYVSYNINGNTITGTYNDLLPAYNALTVRLTLPEGYFVGAKNNNSLYYLIIGLSIIFVIISAVLWALFGKDSPVIETVEFYPPQGYNSAEVGFLYYGQAENNAIISLLIYLADKGYLKIEEIETKVLFSSSKDFRITKLKEYDGNNESEKIFFNGLFERKDSVTSADLRNRFYLTVNSIKKLLNSRENKKKIYDNKSLIARIILIPMILLLFILITIFPFISFGLESEIIIALLFPGIALYLIMSNIVSNAKLASKIFIIIFALLWGGIPFLTMVLPIISSAPIYAITYIIGIICIIIMCIFRKIIYKRTPFGSEMLGKLKGFKRFLETAEKEQLESLVEQNPEYFYNILPYTYALGVSEKWVNQFEGIAFSSPSWYDSGTAFSVASFNTFMNSTMSSVSSTMTSSPSSSGGGSSGGGSGGGGGSSW